MLGLPRKTLFRKRKTLEYGISKGKNVFAKIYDGNVEKACSEQQWTRFYDVTGMKDQIEDLEHSGDIVFVRADSIKAKEDQFNFSVIPIRTYKYWKDIGIAQYPFVAAGYGEGVNLDEVMGHLLDIDIDQVESLEDS